MSDTSSLSLIQGALTSSNIIFFTHLCILLQPVIPVFTQNLREAFRSVGFGKRLWLKLYTITKLPFVSIYGGFPVKLRTHVGKPIPYDGNLTPEQLHIKVCNISRVYASHRHHQLTSDSHFSDRSLPCHISFLCPNMRRVKSRKILLCCEVLNTPKD